MNAAARTTRRQIEAKACDDGEDAYEISNTSHKTQLIGSFNAAKETKTIHTIESIADSNVMRPTPPTIPFASHNDERPLSSRKSRTKRKKRRVIGVNLENCKYESVRRCIASMGWKEANEDEDWVLYWTDSSVTVERVMSLKKYQKINHFPGTIEISRKVNMARNLRRMQKAFPEEYDITPKTWILPQEMTQFKKALSKKKKRVYIIKPDAGAQGKGIYMVRKPEDLVFQENGHFMSAVAQRYVDRPLLLDGFKFDLRIYALVMSCDPLKIFLYKEGMGRFCTEPYREPTDENMENIFMHLTNYSINKNNDNFIYTDNPTTFGEGSKRTLSAMKGLLEKHGLAWDIMWSRIADIIIKTMICIQPMMAHIYRTCVPDDVDGSACFEILGFDIIIDEKLRPLLLEVNHSPSLTCDSGVDSYIKDGLLKSVCTLLRLDDDYLRKYNESLKAKTQLRIFGSKHRPDDLGSIEKEMKECQEHQMWEDQNLGLFSRIYPTAESSKYDVFFTAAWSGSLGDMHGSMARKATPAKKAEEPMKTVKISAAKPIHQYERDRRVSESKRLIVPSLEKQFSRLNHDRNQSWRTLSDGQNIEQTIIKENTAETESTCDSQTIEESSSPRPSHTDPLQTIPLGSRIQDANRFHAAISKHDSGDEDSCELKSAMVSDAEKVCAKASNMGRISHSTSFQLAVEGHSSMKRDIHGLTESQLHEMCLPVLDDYRLSSEYSWRDRTIKKLRIRERVAFLLSTARSVLKPDRDSSKQNRDEHIQQHNGENPEGLDPKCEASLQPSVSSNELQIDPQTFDGASATCTTNTLKADEQEIDSCNINVSVFVPAHLKKELMFDPTKHSGSKGPIRNYTAPYNYYAKRPFDVTKLSSIFQQATHASDSPTMEQLLCTRSYAQATVHGHGNPHAISSQTDFVESLSQSRLPLPHWRTDTMNVDGKTQGSEFVVNRTKSSPQIALPNPRPPPPRTSTPRDRNFLILPSASLNGSLQSPKKEYVVAIVGLLISYLQLKA
eukprot:TRINITY_DN1756_c0_g1_i10.p1 TRINITY_DN1756_c0_g1~~TRINITY_DN1756_c0_g1_i10.p1  ORF type:complete len:1011 (-),score=204.59 TRINITY_DN1756_c0_g1_i10:395-3427(-)